jgi:hypothetical protein
MNVSFFEASTGSGVKSSRPSVQASNFAPLENFALSFQIKGLLTSTSVVEEKEKRNGI